MDKKLVAKNKKAHFDFEILDTIEAGIVLTGAEVKSVKSGTVDLKGSYVSTHGTPALEGAHIPPYQQKNQPDYDPKRRRILLLKKKEADTLRGTQNTEGLTVIPLEVYLKKGFVKVLVGVCKGRKKYDKREVLKKRTQQREIDRRLSRL